MFAHVSQPSASCFAVVSAASLRTASSSFVMSLMSPRMTFSGILVFLNLDSTAKVVQYVLHILGTFSSKTECGV